MQYIALGFAVLALLTWVGRSGLPAKRAVRVLQWRFLAGGVSVAAFAAAAFMTMRGGWGTGIVLFVLGLWMATLVRAPRVQPGARRSAGGQPEPVGLSEARSILGVSETASRDEIEDAYKRLMRLAHPDQGGTTGLAAQLNAARDRLLRG